MIKGGYMKQKKSTPEMRHSDMLKTNITDSSLQDVPEIVKWEKLKKIASTTENCKITFSYGGLAIICTVYPESLIPVKKYAKQHSFLYFESKYYLIVATREEQKNLKIGGNNHVI